MKKLAYALALSTALFLIIRAVALAGGWAVITLDYLQTKWAVDEPVTIGFMVRQHGVTPLGGLSPKIEAVNKASGESFHTVAKDEGARGHYAAVMKIPSAGTWEWSIDAFSFAQPMPTLQVVDSAATEQPKSAVVPAVQAIVFQPLALTAIAMGLIGMLLAGIAWLATRRRAAVILFALALTVMLIGAVGTTQVSARQEQKPSAAMDQAGLTEQGRALFVAKGCIVCHVNDRAQVSRAGFRSLEVGPNLTNRPLTKEFLYVWLKDPSSVRPGTQMPILGLGEGEIKALAEFLTAEQNGGK